MYILYDEELNMYIKPRVCDCILASQLFNAYDYNTIFTLQTLHNRFMKTIMDLMLAGY